MEIRILGPLEVCTEALDAPVVGYKQRAVIGLLAATAPEWVGTSELLDVAWPSSAAETEDRPNTGVLHSALLNFRKRFTLPADRGILSRTGAYRLDLEEVRIDAHAFLAAANHALTQVPSDADSAAQTIRSSLDLWRGDPLPEIQDHPKVEPVLASLIAGREQLRVALCDALIASGNLSGAHSELSALLSQRPDDEALASRVVRVVFGLRGRSAALEFADNFISRQAVELGIECSTAFKELRDEVDQDRLSSAPQVEQRRARPRSSARLVRSEPQEQGHPIEPPEILLEERLERTREALVQLLSDTLLPPARGGPGWTNSLLYDEEPFEQLMRPLATAFGVLLWNALGTSRAEVDLPHIADAVLATQRENGLWAAAHQSFGPARPEVSAVVLRAMVQCGVERKRLARVLTQFSDTARTDPVLRLEHEGSTYAKSVVLHAAVEMGLDRQLVQLMTSSLLRGRSSDGRGWAARSTGESSHAPRIANPAHTGLAVWALSTVLAMDSRESCLADDDREEAYRVLSLGYTTLIETTDFELVADDSIRRRSSAGFWEFLNLKLFTASWVVRGIGAYCDLMNAEGEPLSLEVGKIDQLEAALAARQDQSFLFVWPSTGFVPVWMNLDGFESLEVLVSERARADR